MSKLKPLSILLVLCLMLLGVGPANPVPPAPQSPPGAPLVEIVSPTEGQQFVGGMYLNAYAFDFDGISLLRTIIHGPQGLKLEWNHELIEGYDCQGYGYWIGLGSPYLVPGAYQMRVIAWDNGEPPAQAHDGWVHFTVSD